MLTMVMAKPMQLTIVRAVPLSSVAEFCATRVENKGESATTITPQKNKNAIKRIGDDTWKIKGSKRQQLPEKSNDVNAVRLMPYCWEI